MKIVFVLILMSWGGGRAITTVDGFATSEKCKKAAEYALSQRIIDEAFCISRDVPDAR